MTVVILCIDGVDSRYVAEHDLLASLNPQNLNNDLDGLNALFTWRVWPCILAGEYGGKSDSNPYEAFEDPENPWIWERHGAAVFNGLTGRPVVQKNQETFPDGYHESFKPESRMHRSLNGVREGALAKIREDYPLVVAGTRVPDIAEHHLPDEADDWVQWTCEFVEEVANEADEYLVVSDHGFEYENFGKKGIEAHTRHATFASSFCDYSSMYRFVEGWVDDLDDVMQNQQLEALGYA